MPLRFQSLNPKEFLAFYNNAYAESRNSDFKEKVKSYLESLKEHERQNEKALVANVLKPFFEELGFQAQAAYKQKGNSEIDLALLKSGNVEIIIEAKKPENTAEMFSKTNTNCKALHECILYYLREREGENQKWLRNASVRYVMITNFYQFYIFSALEFKRLIESNKEIRKIYNKLNEKGSVIENQNDFYAELAKVLDSKASNLRGGGQNILSNAHSLIYATTNI